VVPGGPLNVNGTVMVNWLPKPVEVELLYHAVKALVSATVISVEVSPVLVGVKWKSALVISRVGE
jgi:hypothetical protein